MTESQISLQELPQTEVPLFFFRCSDSQMEEMSFSTSSRSFLSQGQASSQAGPAGPQGLPGRIRVPNIQRNSARERDRSRSPLRGNEHRSWLMNTTTTNSAGRMRMRTTPPGHDNTRRDATAPGPSSRGFQPAPAHRAAWEQPQPREGQQSRTSRPRCNLCRRLRKLRDCHQSEKKRRKHSFGTCKPQP